MSTRDQKYRRIITNSIFGRHAIITIESTGSYIILKTYDALHGSSMRMYIDSSKLYHWIDSEAQNAFLDHDCGSFAIMRRISKECISVRLTWLHSLGNHDVKGYTQDFDLPADDLMAVLLTEDRVRRLVSLEDKPCQAQITITNGAHRQIRALDKLHRWALSKAMRDSFKWKGSCLCLYADWGSDFSFVEQKLSGGLCLHDTRIAGKDRKLHSKLCYQVHT